MTNADYFVDLTPEEMLQLWKRVNRMEDVRRDCVIEREDGIDLDNYLQVEIDRWYATLLLTADVSLLPVEDVASSVTLVTSVADGCVVATLPGNAVRLVEWRLDGWNVAVTVFHTPDSEVARRQLSPWLRAGCCCPVAVDLGDRLMLYGIPETARPTLLTARCVVRPADGHYRFHASLLPDGN